MTTIQNVQRTHALLAPLVDHVRATGPDCAIGLTARLPAARDLLALLPPEARNGYPTSLPLHLDADLAVLAMVTAPGQSTSIHDHVTWCVTAVLAGREREERFAAAEDGLHRTSRREDPPGTVSTLGPDVVHRVTAVGPEVALSLHVYGADLRSRSSVRTTYGEPVVGRVEVPGASLYVEERGVGPVVLLLPGGAEDSSSMAALAEALAPGLKVFTLDPRGNSRSHTRGEPTDVVVDEHADDAAAVLRAVADGPAVVVGTSGGAQVALALAVRHPELVRTVVAHEPPCVHVLADRAEALAQDRAVLAAYRSGGVPAAVALFAGEHELPPLPPDVLAQLAANLDRFFAHGLEPISAYLPDVEALRSGAPLRRASFAVVGS